MKGVVNRNKSALKACYERALKTGEAPVDRDIKVRFNVTVGTSGKVQGLTLGGDARNLPSLTRCLKGSVLKWIFPPNGEDSRLEFPFVFTPR